MKFPDPPKSEQTDVFEIVGMIIGMVAALFLVLFVAAVVHAFVISMLWEWYIVPHFGAIPLTIPVSFGIGLLFSYLTYPLQRNKEKAETNEMLLHSFLRPIFALMLGWIGTLFM